MVDGSTPRALASLRMVWNVGFCLRCSNRLIVGNARPALVARSRWDMKAFSLKTLNFITLFYHHIN